MTTLNADNVKVGANSISVIGQMTAPLPALIDRAATVLAEAKSAAEVLEACEMASVAYDKAKTAARLAKAKQAHDDLIAAIYSAQGDAMMIEAQAKQRLADEYDAAQVRGEVASGRDGPGTGVLNGNAKATAADIGLTRKDIHDARMVRDAEAADPGVVRRAVDEAVAAGREPTKAMMRRAVKKVVQRGKSKLQKKMSSTKAAEPSPALKETQHDRDIRVLFSLWDASCASAREEFQSKLPEMVNLTHRRTGDGAAANS